MPTITTLLFISSIPLIINSYYLSLSVLEWKNASRFCESYCNSNLPSFHNSSQYIEALKLITNNNYTFKNYTWIGLNDIQSDQFSWSDASPLDFGSQLDGKYPWRWSEPDLNNALPDGVAIESTQNRNLWVDKHEVSNFHFLCDSCSTKLTKYVAINGFSTYNEANKQCENTLGTTLASIHNRRDMEEARTHCKSVSNIAGCWIGLQLNKILNTYEWDDGTEWDFGTLFNTYPWYHTKSGYTPGQNCIQIDPYPENYLWDDANCNISGRILCNAPSEICDDRQFFIINETSEWIWKKAPCAVESNVINMDDSIAIINNKQYYNSNGVLLVDMMFTMNKLGRHGNGGIAFHFDENNCNNYYVIGIWGGYDLIFLGKFINGIWELIHFEHIGMKYIKGVYYNMQIELINGIEWNVKLNDKFMFNVNYLDDTFDNIGNKYSGYIGIRNSNASMSVKSLFISGDTVYMDSNLLYLTCNNISTMNPTVNPTIAPTMKPTRVTIGILDTTTTSSMIFIEDDGNIMDNEFEVIADLELFWIIAIPVIFIGICICVSYSVNKYCCNEWEAVEGEDEEIV